MNSHPQPAGGAVRGVATEVLISADSHVIEPLDLFTTRLPADQRSKVSVLAERRGDKPGATDPADRLGAMQADDVSMEVLYPTYAMRDFGLEDVPLQQASFRVYNEWIAEYCAATPGRLVGLNAISSYDIDHAVEALHRGTEAGLRGCLLWHVPPPGLSFATDHYDRLWAAAQELDTPVTVHILSGFSYAHPSHATGSRGVEMYRGNVGQKLADGIDTLFDFIFYGVFDRFPRLKLVLAEFEIGWIPWVLQQWDYYVKRFAGTSPLGLELLPSEYFERNIFATFFNDHLGTREFASGWGIENCLWSSDFPHGNTTWPESRAVVDRDLGSLAPGARARLVRGNVTDLYHLDVPAPIGVTG